MASPTYRIISQRIGQGGATNDPEIKRVRRLLRRCGYDLGHNPESAKWDETVQAALMHFQTYWRESVCLNTDPAIVKQFIGKSSGMGVHLPVRPYLDPDDKAVWALAENAGCLFQVCANKRGSAAFTAVHDWLVAQRTPYGGYGKDNGPSHMVFGLEGHPNWAIQIETNTKNVLPKEWQRCLHCTSYQNLMLSVWAIGNCHSTPYAPGLGFGGNLKSLANSRYGYQRQTVAKGRKTIRTYNELKSVLQPGRLYAMELCTDKDSDNDGVVETDFVYHYTLIFNDYVYQANVPISKGVYSMSIDQWWSNKKSNKQLMIYGPSPS